MFSLDPAAGNENLRIADAASPSSLFPRRARAGGTTPPTIFPAASAGSSPAGKRTRSASMSEPTTRTLDANTRDSRRGEDLGRSGRAFSLAIAAAAAAAAARFAARSDWLARDEDRLFSALSSRLAPRNHGFSESGKRKAESGKRKAESGKRKAESGKRKTESGKR